MATMRDAMLADLPAIVGLLADDDNGRLREDPSLPLDSRYRIAFDEIAGADHQRLIVAEDSATIIGTMQLSILPGLSFLGARRMQIEAVRIASAVRGQRLGRAMIEWAIGEARADDCLLVQLTSACGRRRAHAFYERLGFTKSHVGMKLYLRDPPRIVGAG